jgi:dipeptidyl aminopeptidase/acylaminoacyl peptidase
LIAAVALAQQAKRPLTHNDYASWRSIASPRLSQDGKQLAYALFPQEGDGSVIVRNLATGKEVVEAAGELPPPPEPDPESERPAGRQGIRMAFTNGGRFLVASTYPSHADTEKAKTERKRPDEMPKGGLLIIDTASGTALRIPDVRSFQVPEEGGTVIAYLCEPKPAAGEARPATEAKSNDDDSGQRGQGGGAAPAARPGGRNSFGTDLKLRDLSKPDGAERVFADVLDYSFSKDGRTLVYTVSSRKAETNGVYTVAVDTAAEPAALLAGKGKYNRLTWDRTQAQLAFASDRDDQSSKPPKYKVYLWDRKSAQPAEVVSPATPGFRQGWEIPERGPLSFTRDGSRLLIGCAPVRPPEPEADTLPPADERVNADLWSWKDDFIQPMQKVRAARERSRTYTAVLTIADKKFVQLGTPDIQTISASDDGRYAIGGDDRSYRRMVDYDGNYSDYYLLDTANGERRKLIEKLRGNLSWSPDGRYVSFFQDNNWHTIAIPSGTLTNLTANRGVNFYNEDNDSPSAAGSYGTAGWTNDGNSVLLYDRYDVWQISADGRTAKNLTNGFGRKSNLQFRVVRLEAEDEDEPRGIDTGKPLILRAENLETRDTGFFRARFDGAQAPEKLMMGAKNFRTVAKAKDADVVLLTGSTFREFPNLQVTDTSFKQLRKVSDANPQQAQISWGSAELIRYTNSDGVSLQATLYKPENFDPSKKYPMLVYIYERLSQNLHNFVNPAPGTSINVSYYVSNGYVVLEPDIIYTIGWPGQSALKCVLPAIQAVVDKGFINEKAIGIQGHSWGGYQIAYMITQTNRFAAAEAGAPVSNMTSAYDGIRWGTGLPRQFQYEKTQSRIGGTLWDYPVRFVENSPIFHADKVQTPLLILHNDADDAVPWYQGIEYFLALRRLNKEVYMFSYNGEPHGIRRRPDQKDYTVRMQQFFDHFLKGAPAPKWMTDGIPYIDRDAEKLANK